MKPVRERSEILRLGAYQGPCEPSAREKNAETALRVLRGAHRRKIDFACLPEAFLSGYGAPDELREGAIDVRGEWFRRWVRQCDFDDMVSIVGFIETRAGGLCNSAAIIQRRKLLGIYTKSMSGSKHEKTACSFVSRFPVWRAHGISFGVIICVESSVPEPCLLLAERGARVIFEPHYSFIPADSVERHRQRVRSNHIARAVENQCWIVKANTITEPGRMMGGEEGFGYGESMIVDPLGVIRADAGVLTTGWITVDVPKRELTQKRSSRVAALPEGIRRQMARLYA